MQKIKNLKKNEKKMKIKGYKNIIIKYINGKKYIY